MSYHLNHGNSAKVYEKRNGIENFMILTILIYFETNTFIWLESSEVDNVRTSGLKRFSYRYFQISLFTNSKFRNICCSKKFIISEHPSVAMNEIDDSLLFQFPDKNQEIQNSSSNNICEFSYFIHFVSLSYLFIF